MCCPPRRRSAEQLYLTRWMILHIAYKNMMAKVIDTSLQIHGSLGYTLDTPLASWYAEARMQRLVDGTDEVHRWTVGRNVVKAFQEHGTTALAAGGALL